MLCWVGSVRYMCMHTHQLDVLQDKVCAFLTKNVFVFPLKFWLSKFPAITASHFLSLMLYNYWDLTTPVTVSPFRTVAWQATCRNKSSGVSRVRTVHAHHQLQCSVLLMKPLKQFAVTDRKSFIFLFTRIFKALFYLKAYLLIGLTPDAPVH